MKNLKLLVIATLLFLPLLVSADGIPVGQTGQDFLYSFHLYYDNGKLVADRDFQYKYDVIPEQFVAEVIKPGATIYKGEVVNLKNEIAAVFQFDPQAGDTNFKKGKITVRAPYYADANEVKFYDNQGLELLTISVVDSSFCNDDGVCNSNVGEDTKTCPNDCKATPIPTVSNQPNSGSSGSMMIIIYSLIAIVLAVGGWFGWKWWSSRKSGSGGSATTLPPEQQPYIPVK